MTKHRLPSLLFVSLSVALALSSAPAGAAERRHPGTPPNSFASAYQRGSAWSVGVYVFVAGEEDPRIGAGFFVDDQGFIATAAHVLGDAQQILVGMPDRRLLAAQVQGRDETSDIALLRVEAPAHMHPVFAKAGSLSVGDWVMAVGEPFGLDQSVSAGIVSGKDRHFGDDGELVFIQSDVALNPGNSGGPLLNAAGAIVGMNARTIVGPLGTPGASLAIPIDIVTQVIGELRRGAGEAARPRLGAQFDDVPPLTAWASGRHETSGAIILSVPRGSLAERFQLRAGDIVTMMNGRPVSSSADLVYTLLAWRKVSDARIVVQRAGKELVLGQE